MLRGRAPRPPAYPWMPVIKWKKYIFPLTQFNVLLNLTLLPCNASYIKCGTCMSVSQSVCLSVCLRATSLFSEWGTKQCCERSQRAENCWFLSPLVTFWGYINRKLRSTRNFHSSAWAHLGLYCVAPLVPRTLQTWGICTPHPLRLRCPWSICTAPAHMCTASKQLNISIFSTHQSLYRFLVRNTVVKYRWSHPQHKR